MKNCKKIDKSFAGTNFQNFRSITKYTLEVIMKRISKVLAGAVLVLLALAACAPAAASTASEQIPQITVTGSGIVYVVPDTAYINVGVNSKGDTVTQALEQNNAQGKAIRDTLIAQGVDEKDIQTSNFNVYPQSEYDYQGAITRTYYSVDNTVYVTVRDLGSMSNILDAVVNSGANNIYGITFDVQDKTEAQASARKLAVESAQSQAVELAQAAGVEVGDLITISSYYSYPAYYYGMGGGGGAGYAMSETVPIASGQIQVSAEVTMSFAIK